MKMLMNVRLSHEPFNTLLIEGEAMRSFAGFWMI